MAILDQADATARLIRMLPRAWFSDAAKAEGGNTFGLMTAAGYGDSWVYRRIQTLKKNSRLLTTQDMGVLALIAQDFLTAPLPPLDSETPESYRLRIVARMFIPGGTREGIRRAVYNLTGKYPVLIEPWNPNDCGAYDTGPWGYDIAGAWGDLSSPWTGYAHIQRASSVASDGQPYAYAYDSGYAGYDSSLGDYADLQPIQLIPDALLYDAVNRNKAYGTAIGVQLQ